jgi:putative flavoprotein involved in K+ transport
VSIPARIDTVVIGAGQAGLSLSSHLAQGGRDHVVLDRRPTLGGGWQDRWDDFCLVTPNWSTSFPGDPYAGPDPGGFMVRDSIVGRLRDYARRSGAPLSLETDVQRLSLRADGGFTVQTNQGEIAAERVVVAAGSFHAPKIPPIAASLPAAITQLHSHAYRSEAALPSGGVLVVGSGQSGVQIAEELAKAGRDVYLSVGSAGRVPRRYRGRDIFEWLYALMTRGEAYGVTLPTVETLPDPRLRSAGNPHLSGHDGGHDTNLRRMAKDGITLLGRIESIEGGTLRLAPDLPKNLAIADGFFDARFRPIVEQYIERAGIDAPPDDREAFTYEPPVLETLDLTSAGISTVIWTTGYRLDYGWVDIPILDDFGFPRQHLGVSDVPGLYFLGLLWQRNQGSATLFGVGPESLQLARAMGLPASDAHIESGD